MKSFRNFFAVYSRELAAYFSSPVAYVIIIIFLLILSGFTFLLMNPLLESDNASLAPFFFWHPWIYSVLVPAVGMRLWSEEHRLGTMELLLTFPIQTWHAIAGKYFAALTVWVGALLLTFPVVLTVNYLGDPDFGPIITSYISSILYAASTLAITMAISAFTRSQVVCFIISVAICFTLLIIGFPGVLAWMTHAEIFNLPVGTWLNGLSGLSLLVHYQQMTKGVIPLGDVTYFISVIIFSFALTAYALRIKRA